MYEDARKIFDFLPIEPWQDSLYIQHLWGAFETIMEKDHPVRPFSILPFHLLFMFSVQYKVYRLSAYQKEEYLKILKLCRIYDEGQKQVLEKNPPIGDDHGNILSSCSVRNLSLIPEKQIFDFFKIVNLDDEFIKKAKEMVEIRGTYAHANGRIEEEIEKRIEEYLQILENIQECFSEVNEGIQNWSQEIEEGESAIEDFFRERFLQSQFSPRDFGDVVGKMLESEKLSYEQWGQVIDKGLELSYDRTIFELKYIETIDGFDQKKKSKATSILQGIGESSVLSLDEAQDLGLI